MGRYVDDLINQRIAENNDKVLVNLASNEYFKAVNPKINADIITPRFEDGKGGSYKVVSFYAKKARGLMVKYAAQHNLQRAEDLKDFDLDGYYFVEKILAQPNMYFDGIMINPKYLLTMYI